MYPWCSNQLREFSYLSLWTLSIKQAFRTLFQLFQREVHITIIRATLLWSGTPQFTPLAILTVLCACWTVSIPDLYLLTLKIYNKNQFIGSFFGDFFLITMEIFVNASNQPVPVEWWPIWWAPQVAKLGCTGVNCECLRWLTSEPCQNVLKMAIGDKTDHVSYRAHFAKINKPLLPYRLPLGRYDFERLVAQTTETSLPVCYANTFCYI